MQTLHARKDSTAFLRNKVNLDPAMCTWFAPTELTDTQASETLVKRGVIGAVFSNSMSKLPAKDAALCWEVEVTRDPPAQIRPCKPKMWLMGRARVKAGVYYRVD